MRVQSVLRRCLVAAAAASVLFTAAYSAHAVDARKANAKALTDAEKAKVLDLIRIMFSMQLEDGINQTLTSCLNPAGQMGDQTCYERSRGLGNSNVETRISSALTRYRELMRTDRLCKDNGRSSGGWTYPAAGLDNDTVGISGPLLDRWCNAMANPVDRATAKFWIMATLANELAHVYQKPIDPMLPAAERLRIACDRERDSDIMSIKFLDMLLARLKNAANNPHSTLESIEAEGVAGSRIADCLRTLGVDDAGEISALVTWLRARRAVYQDRLDNLFNNQINQGNSWRRLYGSTGVYKSPLNLKVDNSMFASMRQLKVMYGNSMATLTVPADGKVPVAYIVTVNKQSQIIVIVITIGANGAICMHTWTDTDFNGIPETLASTVLFPGFPYFGYQVPQQFDAYFVHDAAPLPGFNDSLIMHDTRNGVLMAFDLTNQGFATGSHTLLFQSPLIADPEAGNPSAGGFHTLHAIPPFPTEPPSPIRFIFRHEVAGDDTPDIPAVLGVFDPIGSTGLLNPVPHLAIALAPGNPLGVSTLQPEMGGVVLMSDPGDILGIDSIGHGATQTLIDLVTIPPSGLIDVGPLPLQARPDLYNLRSLLTGEVVRLGTPRHGVIADIRERDFVGGPNTDSLLLSGFPGRLSVFSGDPAPNFQLVSEIVTEFPEPGPFAVDDDPGQTLRIFNGSIDTPLVRVNGSPFIAQTLVDLDADGSADDAAVIARLSPSFPAMQIVRIIDAASPAPQVFPAGSISFEPAGYTYQNFNSDGRADLRVEDATGGPALCLQSVGATGFIVVPCPGACPADFNNSGTLSVQDIFDFLAAFFGGLPTADFNNSGGVTVQDLFDFLAAYFMGCE